MRQVIKCLILFAIACAGLTVPASSHAYIIFSPDNMSITKSDNCEIQAASFTVINQASDFQSIVFGFVSPWITGKFGSGFSCNAGVCGLDAGASGTIDLRIGPHAYKGNHAGTVSLGGTGGVSRTDFSVLLSVLDNADKDGDWQYPTNSCFWPHYDCDDSDLLVYSGATEICGDGKDNNCNGQIDERCSVCTNGQINTCAYSGPVSTENVGLCKAGVQPCINGQWGACMGEVLPETETCGDGKDNNCDGQIDEGCCDVNIKVSPTNVWPQKAGSDKTTSTIMASLSKPAPPEGCNVKFSVEPIEYSGGHSHGGSRPRGTITPNNISFSSGEMGAKSAKYKSSEVSGKEKIIVKVNDKDTREAMLNVEVPGFFELGEGDVYTLIGQTSTHPENHFGTEETLSALMDIASAHNESAKGTLRINDISLIGGGLFDCDVPNTPWQPPHKSHRVGKNVDVDDVTTEGKKVTKEALTEIIKEIGIKVGILDHGTHFHLTFK